jgi:hypothetical protein
VAPDAPVAAAVEVVDVVISSSSPQAANETIATQTATRAALERIMPAHPSVASASASAGAARSARAPGALTLDGDALSGLR